MDLQIIKAGLKKYPENQVADYCAYLTGLLTQKKKDKGNWVIANPWMGKKTDDYLIRMFKVVASDGLIFDGDNITLLATGISYNYHAYRNKMLLAYPESVIDVNLVHGEDVVKFSKNSGKVEYSHDITDPFNRTEKNLTGGYCVIKNKRGEFLTLLSKGDIDKHRKVSKMDYIWASWFLEMAQKTLIKKACKQHFLDIYSNIEIMDNENYDLDLLSKDDLPVGIKPTTITEKQILEITDLMNSIDGFNEAAFLEWVKKTSVELILESEYPKVKAALTAKKKQVEVAL